MIEYDIRTDIKHKEGSENKVVIRNYMRWTFNPSNGIDLSE